MNIDSDYLVRAKRLFSEAEVRWRAENPELVAEVDEMNRRVGMDLYVLEFMHYDVLERVVWC